MEELCGGNRTVERAYAACSSTVNVAPSNNDIQEIALPGRCCGPPQKSNETDDQEDRRSTTNVKSAEFSNCDGLDNPIVAGKSGITFICWLVLRER
jgi:hypothetical protein